ncbi:MAG TPA: hypothetical protein HPP83_04260 [Candidatus Hydrogenedentes bacterium]|nr:hypothetical protein [Candidatus Hydrogenedentota bacterium]
MEMEPFVFEHMGFLVGTRARDAEDDVVEEVNRFALRPLAEPEFAVFTLDLCHNQVDRHFSRFPDEELAKIDEMVPGRPLMERHDLRGSLPRGTFFRSRLHRADDRVSVRPDVYVLRTRENEDFIVNIEGGVYRETSIGFSFRTPECSVCKRDLRTCDHIPGRSYGDETCHFVMRDVLEVIEGSVVPSGSQGTGFVAQERTLPLGRALENARRSHHRPIELRPRIVLSDE